MDISNWIIDHQQQKQIERLQQRWASDTIDKVDQATELRKVDMRLEAIESALFVLMARKDASPEDTTGQSDEELSRGFREMIGLQSIMDDMDARNAIRLRSLRRRERRS